ncbi:hypothetical protein EDD22DRAFT_951741 [Suillus occidentalis]|nr:hypothetical protein EDD22DRAFT_951741 [Suillus occidentalis]
MRREKESGGIKQEDRSSLSLLLKAEESVENVGLTSQEVLDEVYTSRNSPELYDTDLCHRKAKLLLLTGFETTAVSITAFTVFFNSTTKLRDEYLEFGPNPSYDSLANKLPYLDTVVNEVLHLHAAAKAIERLERIRQKFNLNHWS